MNMVLEIEFQKIELKNDWSVCSDVCVLNRKSFQFSSVHKSVKFQYPWLR